MNPLLALALIALAGWEAWRWYAVRILSAPEEGLSLALVLGLTALAGLARDGRAIRRPVPVMLPAALLAAYAVAVPTLPPVFRFALASAALLACLHRVLSRARPPLAFWGLMALAGPVLPSLQMTFGYPMRIASAALAQGLLRLEGLAVTRSGTFLGWRGAEVQIDAPCSGITMLWALLLLALAAALIYRLSPARLMLAATAAGGLSLAGNALRTASLFHVEAGLVPGAAPWWHEGIGLVAFAATAAALLWVVDRLAHERGDPSCPA